jgi:hypothetical protein
MAKKKNKTFTSTNVILIICTYSAALLILNFGHMNPIVVAFMPCLALAFSILLKR